MKAQSTGNKYIKGMATLELLIAFVILILCTSAVIMVAFGNQSFAVDSETNNEAIQKAQKALEDTRALSRQDFDLVVSDPNPIQDGIYTKQIIVDPFAATECSRQIESKITWDTDMNQPQSINLFSRVGDIPEALDLGGDCSASPPGPGFTVGGGLNMGGAKTNGLDVLNKKVFIALQDPPGLAYVDATNYAAPVQIMNSYDVGSEVNDVDIARDLDTGEIYAYVARETNTNQLQIIDVTDINNPIFVRNVDLPEVGGSSEPEGYRVYYYKNRLYMTTKETAGPELHIFDASDPVTSFPKFGIKELNRTVNDLVVVDQNIGGTNYSVAYMVADSDLKEIGVFDVTTAGTANEMFSLNMTGGADAYSLFFSSTSKLLYVGRQANAGQEFFAYDASNSFSTLIERAKREVGEHPIGLRIAGAYAYMVTNDSNEDFQTYNADPATGLSHIRTYNASNKGTGIDYEDQFIYETMEQGSETLQIYYAP
ncbi:hypothetical protein A3A95_02260 [Candidatus Nomurabacteria bacterium RIFCSPLOWO2_01_FULL_39_18]|uniref:Uncharacterized protein n=1 Tax=Candidatus Nomurabacteria bacterium RIFCSPHIGHO2_01_FULL_40_24b TaxID=1801739 RepID=A0A1F6V5K1_9BACT|nr:MAG: hypothetical protein A2647_02015 [Candidatus Nomurabacteria bacterium RIFCSPHIGHO2_01_FULL_40_24b]OGI90686.1 MAG: hypothetical protein A3A95_02260 [Candidatus Nomurabacteria bacterium RIFCSPLOWO2_01_FULL_39_18]